MTHCLSGEFPALPATRDNAIYRVYWSYWLAFA
jgi:hypothetical protein